MFLKLIRTMVTETMKARVSDIGLPYYIIVIFLVIRCVFFTMKG